MISWPVQYQVITEQLSLTLFLTFHATHLVAAHIKQDIVLGDLLPVASMALRYASYLSLLKAATFPVLAISTPSNMSAPARRE